MNFWMTVLAAFVGILIWDFLAAFLKAVVDRISERQKQKRRIGFDGTEYSGKTAKETTMRKIGFGAND